MAADPQDVMQLYEKVRTKSDLESLDESEIIEGYRDAFDGLLCGNNRSRSYWHGWRNGYSDKNHIQPDNAQMQLASEIVKG